MKKIAGILILLASLVGLYAYAPVNTAAAAGKCETHFMGLRAWYDGYVKEENGNCVITGPQIEGKSEAAQEAEVRKFVWTIVMNVVSMVLGIIGYVAIGVVIYGGFQYMLSQGDPGRAARGRKTVVNASIGIAVVMTASIISGAVSDIISGAAGNDNFFLDLFNTAFLWGGIIASIMIVWGGIQYIMSVGDPNKTSKAKNTILYSAIGLLLVILAATIINTVVGAVK